MSIIHPWIKSSQFKNIPQQEVLLIVKEEVKNQARPNHLGKLCSVVFDLDSTFFDVKPRTLKIMKEFALTEEAKNISQKISDWVFTLQPGSLLYTIEETAAFNKIPQDQNTEKFLQRLRIFWQERFFTSHYLLSDHLRAGARKFSWDLWDSGAHIIYLTGRDRPNMAAGTAAQLLHWGLPFGLERTELLLKPEYGMSDQAYKDEVLRHIKKESNVIALFDNEPANFFVFDKNFPKAYLIFLESTYSQLEAPVLNRELYKIKNFLY